MSVSTSKGKLFSPFAITGVCTKWDCGQTLEYVLLKKSGMGGCIFLVLLSPSMFVIITSVKLYQLASWMKLYSKLTIWEKNFKAWCCDRSDMTVYRYFIFENVTLDLFTYVITSRWEWKQGAVGRICTPFSPVSPLPEVSQCDSVVFNLGVLAFDFAGW